MLPGNARPLALPRPSTIAAVLLAIASCWCDHAIAGQDETPPTDPTQETESASTGQDTPDESPAEVPGDAVTAEVGAEEDNTFALEAAKARLAALSESGDAKPAALASARSLVEILEATVEAERKIADYQSRIDAAPAEREDTARKRAELDDAKAETVDESLGLGDVKAEITRQATALNTIREESAALASTVERRQSRRSQIRSEGAAVAELLASNEARSNDEIDHREQRIARRRLEARALETERTLYDATDDLLRDRQRLLIRQIDHAEETLQLWSARARALEGKDLQAMVERATAIRDAEDQPLLAAVAGRNVELAERLLELNESMDNASSLLAAERSTLGRIRRSIEADRRRFGGRVTPEIASVLRQRDAALPSEVSVRQAIKRLAERLPKIELERLLLEDELTRLADPANEADRLIADASPPLSEAERREERPRIIELLEERVESFGQPLLAVLNQRVDDLNGLLDTERGILTAIRDYREFVLEETVWVRDSSALDPGLPGRIRAQWKVFADPEGWMATASVIQTQFTARPLIPALGLAPGILVLVFRRSIARRTELAGDRIQRAATDRFRETLLVVGFAILTGLAFAGPVWMVAQALEEQPGASGLTLALDHTLVEVYRFLFGIGVLGAVVRPGGLGERHFHWRANTISTGRRLVVFSWISVLFAVGDRLCGPQQLDLPDLGRLFYTPIPLLLSAFFLLTLIHGRGRTLADHLREITPGATARFARLALVVLTIVPLVAVLTANLGWYEATSLLQRAILRSILFLMLLLVLREILIRGLHAHQRQQTWALRRQREDGADVAEEQDALAEIGQRTNSAIRFCVITLLLAGSWVIWSPLVPAFQVFGEIGLWTYSTVDASGEDITRTVGLNILLLALAAVAATFYAARNIPTVVEVLLVDRFDLERGVKYAIAQLIQWVVVIGGLVFACSMVGLNWQSVQWLAAGFTVGLGFGLQEIFANFISGLIILFEQPVRVGDVVTVGGTTGRISRIRMRSTTITDWDRKELVVPNKQFITQEVVNWSIGESCIRLVLPVGVSYGDDPEKVIATLEKIGESDPQTLRDPASHAHFAGFGESSLNFELRVYLRDTEHLVAVRNRINTAIKQAFEREGITIPFPQRDIHVDMVRREDPETGPAAPIMPRSDARPPANPAAGDRPEGDDPTDADADS